MAQLFRQCMVVLFRHYIVQFFGQCVDIILCIVRWYYLYIAQQRVLLFVYFFRNTIVSHLLFLIFYFIVAVSFSVTLIACFSELVTLLFFTNIRKGLIQYFVQWPPKTLIPIWLLRTWNYVSSPSLSNKNAFNWVSRSKV